MLDVAVIVVLVVFGVLGLVSGALFQVLRLVAVAVAAGVAMVGTGPAMEAFPFLARLPAGGEGLVPAGLFLLAYLLLSLVARVIVKAMHATSPTHGAGDRLLGGLLGLAKGAVLCYFIVAILLAAELSVGRSLQHVDTRQSVAAAFVRNWPVGRVAALLEQAHEQVVPAVRKVLRVDEPDVPSPAPAVDAQP